VIGVRVEEPANHSLIRSVGAIGLGFKEVDAALAKRDRNLHPVVIQDELIRGRQEVIDDFNSS
jgi:hypothetical protein